MTPPIQKQNKTDHLVDQVIDYYRLRHKRTKRGSFTSRVKIDEWLRKGWTVEELKLAIDGNHISPHHCGKNDTGTYYNKLEHIFRDEGQMQHFVEAAETHAAEQDSIDDRTAKQAAERAKSEEVRKQVALEAQQFRQREEKWGEMLDRMSPETRNDLWCAAEPKADIRRMLNRLKTQTMKRDMMFQWLERQTNRKAPDGND